MALKKGARVLELPPRAPGLPPRAKMILELLSKAKMTPELLPRADFVQATLVMWKLQG